MSEIKRILKDVEMQFPNDHVQITWDDFNKLENHIFELEAQIKAPERVAEEKVIHRLKMDMRNRDIWIGMTGNMFIARRMTRTSPTEYSTTGRAEVELSPFDAIRKLQQEQS